MNPKKEYYQRVAEVIINNMKKRKFEGYYCDNVDEAKELLVKLLGDTKKTIAYGGSMTIDDNGFKEYLSQRGHEIIVRENYKTEEEIQELKKRTITSDAFLLSTNAITMNGELVNCDGSSNRLAYLLYGPKEVYVITGMNKVTTDIDTAFNRVSNVASPQNAIRLNRNTPCSKCGECRNCFEDTICCNTVVTRASRIPGRIKVILIGENLGY